MPALSPIDFASVNRLAGDLRVFIGRDLNSSGRSDKYRCPFHDLGGERTPSLQVYEDHYFCFSCSAHGDAVSWVARRNNLTMVEAAKVIDPSLETAQDRRGDLSGRATPRTGSGAPSSPHEDARPVPGPMADEVVVPVPHGDDLQSPNVEIWQRPDYQSKLDALVRGAEGILWSDEGRPALDWLRGRGLADETISRFRLGFFPAPYTTCNPVPGLLDRRGQPAKLRAVRGVTIPWAAPGGWYGRHDDEPEGPRWVGMNVRKLPDDVNAPLPDDVDKCMAVKGSKRSRLYPWPDVLKSQGSLPILLVEGEFDALIGYQVVGHLLHVGTAGGALTNPRNLPPETKAALARCPWILLAFDVDAAGAEAARKWREVFPHKSRRVLLPRGKDLNDFVLAGGDLVAWVEENLEKLRRTALRPDAGVA